MKIMDIDFRRKEIEISIKDIDKGIIYRSLSFHDSKYTSIVKQLYKIIVDKEVNEIHIDTTGFGKIIYDLLSETDIKDKLKAFKARRLQ